MSKPVLAVKLSTTAGEKTTVPAVFDTGSFYTLIRQDCLPPRAVLQSFRQAPKLRAATRGSRVAVAGSTDMIITIGGKKILANVLVSSNLAREMIIGAGTMQMWDISIKNRNGKTRVIVGRDMHDPEITEVD